jgi:hypothetical protein
MPRVLTPARYQLVDGAFNVNSTSFEAWRAVLSATRNLPYNNGLGGQLVLPSGTVGGTQAVNDTVTGTPFPRTLRQVANSTGADFGNVPQSYAGFRRLTDTQIDALALEIVKQVRARGPFLSLAQFINRKLSAESDPLSREGAVQTAIDLATPTGAYSPTNMTNRLNDMSGLGTPGAPVLVTANSKVAYANQNSSPAVPSTSVDQGQGSSSMGCPGWLTQADVLQQIGPVLAARSDTFVIRAYGETVSPFDANATSTAAPAASSIPARAWCEAVVQRLPEYIDPTDAPTTAPAVLTAVDNKQFGRRFRIVAFRWLTPNDI